MMISNLPTDDSTDVSFPINLNIQIGHSVLSLTGTFAFDLSLISPPLERDVEVSGKKNQQDKPVCSNEVNPKTWPTSPMATENPKPIERIRNDRSINEVTKINLIP